MYRDGHIARTENSENSENLKNVCHFFDDEFTRQHGFEPRNRQLSESRWAQYNYFEIFKLEKFVILEKIQCEVPGEKSEKSRKTYGFGTPNGENRVESCLA